MQSISLAAFVIETSYQHSRKQVAQTTETQSYQVYFVISSRSYLFKICQDGEDETTEEPSNERWPEGKG